MTNSFRNLSIKQIGMGLVETLMILLLVSIGIVALMSFQHTLSYNSNTSQQQFDATLLANKQLESLRDFTVLNTTAGYTAYADVATGNSTATVGNTAYTITWTITTNTTPAYKTADVSVSWTNRLGASQSIRLISQIGGIDPSASAAIK